MRRRTTACVARMAPTTTKKLPRLLLSVSALVVLVLASLGSACGDLGSLVVNAAPHDHDEPSVVGDAHLHHHTSRGCNHHHNSKSNEKPRHFGESEYAIVRPEAELYYPPVVVGAGNSSSASGASTRNMKFAGGPGQQQKKVLRQCGVPDPSSRETENTLKVLDAWEAANPGRRQLLLDHLRRGRHDNRRRRKKRPQSNDSETNDLDVAVAATNATTNGTAIVKNLVVNVYWHVIKAGNTPELGRWTRAQVRRSVELANLNFAYSPVVFKLRKVTQTVNDDWFRCEFDKDYSTERQYKTALRREGADTLNVYMCDLRRGQALWGYASFPSALEKWPEFDGIVLANPFTKQDGATEMDAHMTFIHELGHWMGVYHTWTGSCDRSKGGDSVFDTAAHVNNTWFYDGYANCFEGKSYNTCPDNVKGVDPGLDPVLNHMNYVYTPCQFQKGHFTDGQMITMISKFETYRHLKPTCRDAGVPCLNNRHCCSAACSAATKLCT